MKEKCEATVIPTFNKTARITLSYFSCRKSNAIDRVELQKKLSALGFYDVFDVNILEIKVRRVRHEDTQSVS